MTYETRALRIGAQVNNLFNKAYSPVAQATFLPGRRRNGPGRALVLSATYKF